MAKTFTVKNPDRNISYSVPEVGELFRTGPTSERSDVYIQTAEGFRPVRLPGIGSPSDPKFSMVDVIKGLGVGDVPEYNLANVVSSGTKMLGEPGDELSIEQAKKFI